LITSGKHACRIVEKAPVGDTSCRHWWFTACSTLLYDLTSTYFESPPPQDEKDKRRFGYSRDKRRDCVQVIIALIVTPEGFPIAYEVLPGNTADKTTLKMFLQKIETQYGRAERIWVMDRGIPTEEVLEGMRTADPPVYYLVSTPRGMLTKLERALLPLPWQAVRAGVSVKLSPQDGELYVFAESRDRVHKGSQGQGLAPAWRAEDAARHAPAATQGSGEAPVATAADEVQRHASSCSSWARPRGVTGPPGRRSASMSLPWASPQPSSWQAG
jgi:hypothetical protein